MASKTMSEPTLRCHACGYEATAAAGDWKEVEHPPLGTMTQCPECGSTNIEHLVSNR